LQALEKEFNQQLAEQEKFYGGAGTADMATAVTISMPKSSRVSTAI